MRNISIIIIGAGMGWLAAVGIKLADGSQHRADIIISNADGRKTIMSMLEGKYTNKRLNEYCREPADETP